jgi:hypothetical protein
MHSAPERADKLEKDNRERRWAVITADGGHSWIGRHTDPTDAEIEDTREALQRTGVTGWLAIAAGAYYSAARIELLMVRPLYGAGDWDLAVSEFQRRRRGALVAS